MLKNELIRQKSTWKAVLFYLLIFSMLFLNISYGQYIISVSGAENIKVAKPVLEVISHNENLTFDNNENGFYDFSVSNIDSSTNLVTETALTYKIVVILPEDSIVIPKALYICDFTYNNKNLVLDNPIQNTNTEYEYSISTMEFGLNAKTLYYSLELCAKPNSSANISIIVSVIAEQKVV